MVDIMMVNSNSNFIVIEEVGCTYWWGFDSNIKALAKVDTLVGRLVINMSNTILFHEV